MGFREQSSVAILESYQADIAKVSILGWEYSSGPNSDP